jgi:hypothetical protein
MIPFDVLFFFSRDADSAARESVFVMARVRQPGEWSRATETAKPLNPALIFDARDPLP